MKRYQRCFSYRHISRNVNTRRSLVLFPPFDDGMATPQCAAHIRCEDTRQKMIGRCGNAAIAPPARTVAARAVKSANEHITPSHAGITIRCMLPSSAIEAGATDLKPPAITRAPHIIFISLYFAG